MRGLIIDLGGQIVNWVETLIGKIGDEASPEPGDDTLQAQHKTIEELLKTLTGTYRSSEDIVPNEHTLLQFYYPPFGSFSDGFTFNADGHIAGLSGKDILIYNQTTAEVVEKKALNFDGETASPGQAIIRCGNNYAIISRKVALTVAAGKETFTETSNFIFVYDSTFTFVRKITWDAATYGGLKGIAWDSTNTQLILITQKPLVHDGLQYGFQDYLCRCNLDGSSITSIVLPYGHTATQRPQINAYGSTAIETPALSMVLLNEELFFPKIWFAYRSGSVHAISLEAESLGVLSSILLFADTGSNLSGSQGIYPIHAVDNIAYYGGYLYMSTAHRREGQTGATFIARARIHD